jgi:hypothetical protein
MQPSGTVRALVWHDATKPTLWVAVMAILLAGCATMPSSWQRPGATEEIISWDISTCKAAGRYNGYTGFVATSAYLQRCMEDLDYQPIF